MAKAPALEIPSLLVDYILLGPEDDRRQLQDSPVLGDVWAAFARRPDGRLALLITPLMTKPAAAVASECDKRHAAIIGDNSDSPDSADITYLQGIIAANLTFIELLRVVVPMTKWWDEKWRKNNKNALRHDLAEYLDAGKRRSIVDALLESLRRWRERGTGAGSSASDEPPSPHRELASLDRYILLAGLILWAASQDPPPDYARRQAAEKIDFILAKEGFRNGLLRVLEFAFDELKTEFKIESRVSAPSIWHVSLNRKANPALAMSVPAIKADAARTLFKVDCSPITWAVIDSGIDGTHPAFKSAKDGSCRIRRSFDFTDFRKIISLSNKRPGMRDRNVEYLLSNKDRRIHFTDVTWARSRDANEVQAEAARAIASLVEDAGRGSASIHWDLIEPFVEINPKTPPKSNHGTHVAGILGASKDACIAAKAANDSTHDGVCPDINIYDFRVLGSNLEETEFAIIGALQYIRYLNDRDNYLTIHGANLSLSIPHDVRNFACGRTPICTECTRLSDAGVIVVAAAGNHGYKSFETKDGAFDGYAAFSITDPGNADDVITVGSTHRHWPHTYGISFFSSRGPTGDGRLKPDLVAPGERIRAPLPNANWGDLDGTSMAAPHVSGAAAMLLARYSELIGQPRRIKRILCETATDLGRERSFQGAGMLDVLRAFQSI